MICGQRSALLMSCFISNVYTVLPARSLPSRALFPRVCAASGFPGSSVGTCPSPSQAPPAPVPAVPWVGGGALPLPLQDLRRAGTATAAWGPGRRESGSAPSPARLPGTPRARREHPRSWCRSRGSYVSIYCHPGRRSPESRCVAQTPSNWGRSMGKERAPTRACVTFRIKQKCGGHPCLQSSERLELSRNSSLPYGAQWLDPGPHSLIWIEVFVKNRPGAWAPGASGQVISIPRDQGGHVETDAAESELALPAVRPRSVQPERKETAHRPMSPGQPTSSLHSPESCCG